MAHGALGMNRGGETNAPIWGEIGIWCSRLCQTCTALTLPPIFAWRIRFGGAAPVQIYKSAGFPRGALTTLIKPRLGMH